MNFKTILILVLFFPGAGHAQDVVINEFLASNITIYPEMYDFDDYGDWIELYNSVSYTHLRAHET